MLQELLDTKKGKGGWVEQRSDSHESGRLIEGTSFHLVTLYGCIKSCYTISSPHSHQQILGLKTGNGVHLEIVNS